MRWEVDSDGELCRDGTVVLCPWRQDRVNTPGICGVNCALFDLQLEELPPPMQVVSGQIAEAKVLQAIQRCVGNNIDLETCDYESES